MKPAVLFRTVRILVKEPDGSEIQVEVDVRYRPHRYRNIDRFSVVMFLGTFLGTFLGMAAFAARPMMGNSRSPIGGGTGPKARRRGNQEKAAAR